MRLANILDLLNITLKFAYNYRRLCIYRYIASRMTCSTTLPSQVSLKSLYSQVKRLHLHWKLKLSKKVIESISNEWPAICILGRR